MRISLHHEVILDDLPDLLKVMPAMLEEWCKIVPFVGLVPIFPNTFFIFIVFACRRRKKFFDRAISVLFLRLVLLYTKAPFLTIVLGVLKSY